MIKPFGQRLSSKNKVETKSSHCPLEKQLPRVVKHTVSVSMETEELRKGPH